MHEERVTLETPEHVELHLELAGVGSRFLAGFIDSLVQVALIVGLGFAAGYTRWAITGDPSKMGMNIAIVAFSSMLIIIAYYIIFEMAWGGQSPGKRMAGLVVVRDDGGPVGLSESAVRNILRIVDILPIYYTLGMASIFLTRKCKRIGDLAAGTIVIKVRETVPRVVLYAPPAPEGEPTPELTDALVLRARAHITALSPQELDTVARFVERRGELEPEGRRAVAARIAEGLRHKFPALSPREAPDPEVFLEIIHQARLAAFRGPDRP